MIPSSLIDDEPITFEDGKRPTEEEEEITQEKEEPISLLEDEQPFDLI